MNLSHSQGVDVLLFLWMGYANLGQVVDGGNPTEGPVGLAAWQREHTFSHPNVREECSYYGIISLKER